MNSIITVGITGGIGTGKSTICRILSIMGYPVFYSDAAAKEILNTDSKVIDQIKDLFGEQAYSNETINNPFIAGIVFKEPEKLRALNNIVHPAVRARFADWCKSQTSHLVFNEAAILFESGSYRNLNKTILVTSPMELRLTRLKERDQTTTDNIKLRMKNQWDDAQKIELADFIIQNDEKSLLVPQVLTILKKL